MGQRGCAEGEAGCGGQHVARDRSGLYHLSDPILSLKAQDCHL